MNISLREIKRRVASIEQGLATGPLSRAELLELATLEAEHDRIFAVPIDEMSSTEVDDAIAYLVGQVGSSQRLDQLRYRALPLSEQAELRATEIALSAMTFDEIGQWIDEKARAARAHDEEEE